MCAIPSDVPQRCPYTMTLTTSVTIYGKDKPHDYSDFSINRYHWKKTELRTMIPDTKFENLSKDQNDRNTGYVMTKKDVWTVTPIINDENDALKLANALLDSGISIMEITLRTPKALEIIASLKKRLPEMAIGAGTVLNDDQFHTAIKHHSDFIVSPGLTRQLIQVSQNYDAPLLPGAVTPSEIMHAFDNGFEFLKFFPAESYNGIKTLKSLAPVFPNVKFCPTGGITLQNLADYLVLPNVIAVGCSFLADNKLIREGKFNQITQLARSAVDILNQLLT